MINIYYATKYYPRAVALESVHFQVYPGEVVGLFGANGSGKSTLLRSIAGFQALSYGHIQINEKDAAASDQISFISDRGSFFPHLNIEEHYNFYSDLMPGFNQNRFTQLIDFFALPTVQPVGKLSNGQQSKFEICTGLSRDRPILLMDEPFFDKDVMTRQSFIKLMAGLMTSEKTLIIATHLVADVEALISRALLMKDGELIGDSIIDDIHEQGLSLVQWLQKTTGDPQQDMTFLFNENII